MSSPERTASSIECSDALPDQRSLRAMPVERSSKRHLSLSSFEKVEKTLHEENVQLQHGKGYRKPQAHDRLRSVENHTEASSPQSVVSPSPAGPQPPPLSSSAGVSLLPSPTTTDLRPRKRGVAQKLSTKPKRKWVSTKADKEFVVPDGLDDEEPLPKRIKAVATTESSATQRTPTEEPTTGKRKKIAKARVEPKPKMKTPTSALDRAQQAEEARFRKRKSTNKLTGTMKKQPEFKRGVTMNSAQDRKVKKELRDSMSVLPPALSSGRGLDAEFTNKKTRSELQEMHRMKTEATAGAFQARMETDPDDKSLNIMYLAKYTTKIPIFPNVYTDLDKIIAAPYAYPQVELDMEAGEFGILRIRWFPTASDSSYQELAEAALARHKEATARHSRRQRW